MSETSERRFRARPKKMPSVIVKEWEGFFVAKREGWKSGEPCGIGSSATDATVKLVAEEVAYYDE